VKNATVLLNAAELWWVQGDSGEAGTPGGWLRCSGLTVGWVSRSTLAARRGERRRARKSRSRAATTFPGSAEAGTVRLTPVGGGAPIDLTPEVTNSTQFSVWVALPPSLAPGE